MIITSRLTLSFIILESVRCYCKYRSNAGVDIIDIVLSLQLQALFKHFKTNLITDYEIWISISTFALFLFSYIEQSLLHLRFSRIQYNNSPLIISPYNGDGDTVSDVVTCSKLQVSQLFAVKLKTRTQSKCDILAKSPKVIQANDDCKRSQPLQH